MPFYAAAAALLILQGVVLYFLGQPLFCECGYVTLWAPDPLSAENSQMFFDWYTFSHIIHGFIFYWLARKIFPNAGVSIWFAMVVAVEVAWEILENTPLVIEHYRQQALAQGYIGDSILNSVFDTIATAYGFLLAHRFPWWAIIMLAVILEVFTLYMIRDALVLNILGFIAPLDFISSWQMSKQI